MQSSSPDADTAVNCLVGLIPDSNLYLAQHNDNNISKTIEMKEQGFPRPPPFVWRDDQIMSAYWVCWDRLFVTNGLLMKSLDSHQRLPITAVVLPPSLVNNVLLSLHGSPSGGYMGINRTIQRAREPFFWPKMREAIQSFIQNCPECSQSKHDPKKTRAPLQPIQVSEPFVFWVVDYMGPITETARGNKHILVMMDHFTKWCEAFATADQKA